MTNKNYLKKLVEKRSRFRAEKKYEEADKLRKKIEALGFQVADKDEKSKLTDITAKKNATAKKSYLVLFGSGEISSVGRSIHDYVLQQIGKKPVNIAIVSTPAGFQPNVSAVHEEIADFFNASLKNYHPNISIIYANDAKKANDADLIRNIEKSDYIFVGPGSPTYAKRNLENSLLIGKITEALAGGKSLCLSSAAVLAFSKFTLPVYEIYKAGAELYWEKGLDYFPPFMEWTTVIPHKNNNEGGKELDTSYCFMGKARFKKIRKLLPPAEKIIGIDEQTALIIDAKNKSRKIMGKGSIEDL